MSGRTQDVIEEDWGEWECPVCNVTAEDPTSITTTSCPNGHVCHLGPIVHPKGCGVWVGQRPYRVATAIKFQKSR